MPQQPARIFRLIALWALLLAPALAAAQTTTTAHQPAQAAAGSLVVHRTPSAQLPAETTSATLQLDSPGRLLGVRVRSQGETLRLIFLFDRPTLYALRLDPATQRATLDLINTQVAYLPPDIARLGDDRLDGVWVRRLDPGLASLELRLPSPTVRMEHFSMREPPAVVIDFTRTDRRIARVGGPEVSVDLPAANHALPPAVPMELVRSNGAVVPRQWLTTTPQPPSTSAQSVAHPPQTLEHAEASTAPLLAHADPPDAAELGPSSSDFEGFPIEAMDVTSALGQEILEDFMLRRWGMVFNKSVSYMKNNPINKESIDILYLMAEARWRMGRDRADAPLEDMTNVWQQALRTYSDGPMGSFAHSRLAEAALMQNDPAAALHHFDQALILAPAHRRFTLQIQRARAMAGLGRERDALKLLAALDAPSLDPFRKLDLLKTIGAVRQQSGDAPGAWEAFQQAADIDSQWMTLDYENWEKMALAARDTGHYEEAMLAVQELLRNYDNRGKSDNYKLLLLRADLQALQADRGKNRDDLDTAVMTYETLLHKFGESLAGQKTQREALQKFPREFLESEGRYCMILWRDGKHRQAMSELNRIHQQCIREGINPKPLQPIFQAVLPDFMRSAIDENHPFDAIQAWRLYRHFIEKPAVARACRPALMQGFERMGLYRDALLLHNQDRPTTTTAPFVLTQARLLMEMGELDRALPLLEAPLPSPAAPRERRAADLMLAQLYLKKDRKLEAAQAFQAVAEASQADPDQRGEAILEAADLFLETGMPLQAVELGVQALLIESDSEKAGHSAWDPADSAAVRLTLARAYFAGGDLIRAEILLNDYLSLPSTPAEERALARMIAAHAQQRLGKLDAAMATCKAAIDDPETPPIHLEEARQLQKLLEWDVEHPKWSLHTASAGTAKTSAP